MTPVAEQSAPAAAYNMPAAVVVAELQKYAQSMGLVLAARCTRCGAPLWASRSVSAKLGPTCRQLEADHG